MKSSMYLFAFVAISGSLFLAGCTGGTGDNAVKGGAAPKDPAAPTASVGADAEIQANLAQLKPEDRKLADAQKWCAVDDENLLGDMGVPCKVMVKGEPVFLCCNGCQKSALAEPDKTLAKVAALKSKSAGGAK